MKAPAVCGAQTYPELCTATKNNEKRQAELKKQQEYQRPTAASQAAHSFWKPSGLPSQQPEQCLAVVAPCGVGHSWIFVSA